MTRQLISGKIIEAPSNKEGWSFGLKLSLGTILKSFMKVSLVDSSLEIGVRAISLDFKLSNATMPDEDWSHDPVTNQDLVVARDFGIETNGLISSTASQNTSEDFSGNLGVGGGITGGLSQGLKSARNIEEKNDAAIKNTVVEKYNYERFSVIATGDENNPSWHLESTVDGKILRGTALNSAYFARVVANGSNPEIRLEARIAPGDVCVRDHSGAFESINKRIVALIRIRRTLCRKGIVVDEKRIELEPQTDGN